MEHPTAIDHFIEFYNNFSVEDVNRFNTVYDKKVVFQDPFHLISGRDELYQYFKKMMIKVPDCRFDIYEITYDKNETGSAILTWDMHFKHNRLNGGSEITVNGATHIKYSDKILFHRDYFDSSQLLYKNIPVLGSLIRLIEKGL